MSLLLILLSGIAAAVLPSPRLPAADAALTFREAPGAVEVRQGGRPLARYVYEDPAIPRPYFCDVREPGGVPETRHHPPRPGVDAEDHASMHPGLWLAFGDLGGSDFWRNRARVEHERFLARPRGGAAKGGFRVSRRYLTSQGGLLAVESCDYRVHLRGGGYFLICESRFTPAGEQIVFGDQEEMGFGFRAATPIAVRQGGRILNSDGLRNEQGVRGKQAAWCDYSGTVDGRRVGVCLMPDPANFRASWFHARDYGLLVANPFGRRSLAGGEESRFVVPRDRPLRLRFGVFVYGTAGPEPDLAAVYRDFLALLTGPGAPSGGSAGESETLR